MWGKLCRTPSKMMAVSPSMPARTALTAQQQSVKIAHDREDDGDSKLEAEPLGPCQARPMRREQVVGRVCKPACGGEQQDLAVAQPLLQRHCDMILQGSSAQLNSGRFHRRLKGGCVRSCIRRAGCLDFLAYRMRRQRPQTADPRGSDSQPGRNEAGSRAQCGRHDRSCKLGPSRQTASRRFAPGSWSGSRI